MTTYCEREGGAERQDDRQGAPVTQGSGHGPHWPPALGGVVGSIPPP